MGAGAGADRAAAVVSYAQRLIAPPSRARICAGFSEPPGAALFRCYSVPYWRPMAVVFLLLVAALMVAGCRKHHRRP